MSQGREPVIRLANGAVFTHPEERIREYCEIEVYRDVGYRGGYDDHHRVDNRVTHEDLEAANNLYALLTVQDRQRIVHDQRIPVLLAGVADVDLGSLTDESWREVEGAVSLLLAEFLSIPDVKLAKATKVLHLKRPHLFPVLDSFVLKFLMGTYATNLFLEEEWFAMGMKAFAIARADITANRPAFDELQKRLSDLPTPLTTVRLYDILCWTQEKWVNRENTDAKHGTAGKSLEQGPRTKAAPSAPAGDTGQVKTDQSHPGEILTIKEFRRTVARAEGVIVIMGGAHPIAHSPLCGLLTDDRFNQNAVIDKGRTGRYYWRGSLLEARREFGATPCKRCRAGGTPAFLTGV